MNIYEINFYIQAQSITHFGKHKQKRSVVQAFARSLLRSLIRSYNRFNQCLFIKCQIPRKYFAV